MDSTPEVTAGAPPRIIAVNGALEMLPRAWWRSVLLWPSAVLGLLVLIRFWVDADRTVLGTGPSGWIGAAVAIGVAVFFLRALRRRRAVAIEAAGVRLGASPPVAWDCLSHVVRHGDFYELYLQPRWDIPAYTFRAGGPGSVVFEEQLAHNGIELLDRVDDAAFGSHRVRLGLGALALLSAGVILVVLGVSAPIVVLALLAAGVAATHWLERLRTGGDRGSTSGVAVREEPTPPPAPRQLALRAERADGDARGSTWVLEYGADGAEAARLRLELAVEHPGPPGLPSFGTAALRAEPGAASRLLLALGETFRVRVPSGEHRSEGVRCDASILGHHLSLAQTPGGIAGLFATEPAGDWTVAKLFLVGDAEVFVALNGEERSALVIESDPAQADGVLRALAPLG